ncbi:hypothetical protein QVD17_01543 [Tagetes erecta]|uniref:Uncharacterized protein n=1 Tax=Tagetes erecta TaxID=13708 RepID=A0AAD8L7P4_TARER|nr:hypothetical protein QVD17_01543 [Tagetes erecta]
MHHLSQFRIIHGTSRKNKNKSSSSSSKPKLERMNAKKNIDYEIGDGENTGAKGDEIGEITGVEEGGELAGVSTEGGDNAGDGTPDVGLVTGEMIGGGIGEVTGDVVVGDGGLVGELEELGLRQRRQ